MTRELRVGEGLDRLSRQLGRQIDVEQSEGSRCDVEQGADAFLPGSCDSGARAQHEPEMPMLPCAWIDARSVNRAVPRQVEAAQLLSVRPDDAEVRQAVFDRSPEELIAAQYALYSGKAGIGVGHRNESPAHLVAEAIVLLASPDGSLRLSSGEVDSHV